MQTVIIKPLVTEKSMADAGDRKYTFAVAKDASKLDIRAAIKKQFNVDAVNISTSVMKGKKKRVGMRRLEVADSVWKKATITVKKGQKMDLFEPGATK